MYICILRSCFIVRHLIPVNLIPYWVVMPFYIIGLWFRGYIFGFPVLFHPEYQHPIHIYYVKHENAFTCKRICWYLGGNSVEKIFFLFAICLLQKMTISTKNKVVRGSFKKFPDCSPYLNVSCRIHIEIICGER